MSFLPDEVVSFANCCRNNQEARECVTFATDGPSLFNLLDGPPNERRAPRLV